jgi:hypothetical protein
VWRVEDTGAGFPLLAGQGIGEGCDCFVCHISAELYREDGLNGVSWGD